MKDVIQIIYNNSNEPFYYIRLGAFLQFIQDNLMYLVKVQDLTKPMLKFDFDVETNLMYVEDLQVSVDPTICVVNRRIQIENKIYSFIPADQMAEEFESPKLGPKYGQVMNIYVNMRWVLIKLDELKDANDNKVVLISFLNNILSNINGALGGTNKLEATLDDSTNTIVIRDINPLPGTESVIRTLNESTPYKLSDQYAHFDLYGYSKTEDEEYKIANTENSYYGHASFIKEFNFTTEITPGLSTMITVGATANSTVVGENSTAFSKFNVGLTDRFKEQIVQSTGSSPNTQYQGFNTSFNLLNPGASLPAGSTADDAATEEIKALYLRWAQTYNAYIKYLKNLSVEGGKKYNNDADTYKDALVNYTTYLQQARQLRYNLRAKELKKEGKPVPFNSSFAPGTGFIPFNMSLTMDGLSGMKIYSKFFIDTRYLPANYPDSAEFLIKNIEHKIENNKWFTTLESIVISKGEVEENFLKTKVDLGGKGFQNNSGYSNSYFGIPIPASDKTGATAYDNSTTAKSLKSKGKANGQLDINDPSVLEKLTFLPSTANKTYYPDGYFRLYPSAAKAFKAFYNAATSAGYKLTVTSAYRSRQHQASLGSGDTVASPGSSPHGWGGAIDFSELYQAVGGSGDPSVNSYARQNSALYKWMIENGPKFGWHNPYRLADGNGVDEIWHWEYWGS